MEHFPKLSHLQSFPAPYQELVADGVARARAAAANSNISWGQMEEGGIWEASWRKLYSYRKDSKVKIE